MYRGKNLFVCSKCGKRFIAPDFEWCATVFSAPQPCPKCGSIRTRPWSFLPSFMGNEQYKFIWDSIEKEGK